MHINKQQIIARMCQLEITANPPKTQYECCLIGARCSIAVGNIPQNDEEIIKAAWGSAAGVFGPAFEAADYAQKSEWIDMCERALRQAMEEASK